MGRYKPAPLHGRPLLCTASQGESVAWRTNFLIEHWAESGVPTYKGVRSNEGRVYVEYTSGASAGDKELYDIREDPYQLNNLMDDGANAYLGSASRR